MPSFLPERIAIGVLAAAVGWLVYREHISDRWYDEDRERWQRSMDAWEWLHK